LKSKDNLLNFNCAKIFANSQKSTLPLNIKQRLLNKIPKNGSFRIQPKKLQALNTKNFKKFIDLNTRIQKEAEDIMKNKNDKILNKINEEIDMHTHLCRIVEDNIFNIEAAKEMLKAATNFVPSKNLTPIIQRKKTKDELIDDGASFKTDNSFIGMNI